MEITITGGRRLTGTFTSERIVLSYEGTKRTYLINGWWNGSHGVFCRHEPDVNGGFRSENPLEARLTNIRHERDGTYAVRLDVTGIPLDVAPRLMPLD